jgi:signal transduction histidine kinase
LDTWRSDQEVQAPFFSTGPRLAGTVLLSDGPAYGRQIVESVARAWALASLGAVLLAAGAGWLVSRRVTAPLTALTGVTARMAQGDLSARADGSSGDEFGALGQSFNEMAGRVEEMVLALRHFASDAAHELQTPLTALRTNLELASGDAGPQEEAQYLERAQDQVERLSALTRDLLDLSRLEAGAGSESREVVNLAELARRVSEYYAAQADQRGQEFDLRLPEKALPVCANPAQLERLLGNLLENAIKFTPPGGAVTLGLEGRESETCLWVEDTGIGIPPEELDRLFSRFHRGRNASAYAGSGLGLTIVKAIAGAHGGQVWAENRPGGGARFTLCLSTAPRDICRDFP